MKNLKLILTTIGLSTIPFVSFAADNTDFFIRLGVPEAKVVDSIDNKPAEPETPSLKGVCKIMFSNLSTPSWYKIPIHNIEILTKNGVFDFGNLKSRNGSTGYFDNGAIFTNMQNYGHYYPILALKGVKDPYYTTTAWLPESKSSIGYTINFNTPQDLTSISYMDRTDVPNTHYTYLNYAVSARGCDNAALFDKVITQYVSPASGQAGTLNFVE